MDESTTEKQRVGIVVVHGVGNPIKGGTLRELSLGLTSWRTRGQPAATVEFTDSHLFIPTPTEKNPENFYEAPARRFQVENVDYMAAEVFWGDLSQIKPGAIGLIRGLFDLLYGLPAVIKSALKTRKNGKSDPASLVIYSHLIRLAVSSILGPILAITLIGILAITLTAITYLLKNTFSLSSVTEHLAFDTVILFGGFAACVLGSARLRKWFFKQQWSRLTIIFFFYFCLIISIYMFAKLIGNVIWSSTVVSPYDELHLLPTSIIAFWAFAALVNFCALVSLTIYRCRYSKALKSGIRLSFILAELSFILWSLATATVFYVIFKALPYSYFGEFLAEFCPVCDVYSFAKTKALPTNESISPGTLDLADSSGSVNGFTDVQSYNVVSLLFLPFVGLFITGSVFLVTAIRFSRRDNDPPRLIVPDSLFNWLFVFTGLLIFLLGLYLSWGTFREAVEALIVTKELVILGLASLALSIAFFPRQIRHGLDIGLDVSNYWRVDGYKDQTQQRLLESVGVRTSFVERLERFWQRLSQLLIDFDKAVFDSPLISGPATNKTIDNGSGVSGEYRHSDDRSGEESLNSKRFGNDIAGFYKRHNMRIRFLSVLERLQKEDLDCLLVVSHSQGTMIAIDGLRHTLSSDYRNYSSLNTVKMHLVTFGSPYQHLYQHYFSETHHSDPFDSPRPVESWINVHRTNDYIGREILGPGENIVNKKAGPDGHTGYWTDDKVIKHVFDHFNFLQS